MNSNKRLHALLLASSHLSLCCWLAPAPLLADSTVVFNEIMYYPAGNDPDLEWVELHNQMAVDMDISNWVLAGGMLYAFPEGTIVPGKGFVVVSSSPRALEAASGYSGALGPFEGRLGNSDDELELRNNNDRLMDSVGYKARGKWPAAAGGSGASLAKRNPDAASSSPENWESSSEVGGTPGDINFPTGNDATAFPSGLVSYWSFDEASGPALDSVGGNDGTLSVGARRVPGFFGSGSVDFDNTTSAFAAVGVGSGDNFSTTSGITVEALIKPGWSGADSDHDAVFWKEDGDKRIAFGFQNDGTNAEAVPPVPAGPVLAFGLNVGGAYSVLALPIDGAAGHPSLASLKDGNVHHVAATYESRTGLKSIYVDGVAAIETTFTPGSVISSGGNGIAFIGNTRNRSKPFTGGIDEVAFWRKSLDAAEVADHFAKFRAGKGYFEQETPPPPVDRARLTFNEINLEDASRSWIEIVNPGDSAVQLEGHVIARAGEAAGGHVLAAASLPPRGFLQLSSAELGITLSINDSLFLYSPDRRSVLDAVFVDSSHLGRFPDGAGPWWSTGTSTPGAPNIVEAHDEIVINEIMYFHQGSYVDGVYVESPEAWIELYNRSARVVDLTGWSLDEGVEYEFTPQSGLGPGEYLVVAADRDALARLHPGIRIVGNFEKRLSHRSDNVVLRDARGNIANQVRYFNGGHWPSFAHGGGSSLELRDPRADNSRAEAWADSDESSRAGWNRYSYKAVATANVGPSLWNEFVVGLLDAGEALLDDFSVIEDPDGAAVQFLQNGDFEVGGADKWRLLGNHRLSEVITDPGDDSNHVLHLVATGPTEHMHNHLETTFLSGKHVSSVKTYEISFRARWLAGSPQLNTRLYFNRSPRTTILETAQLNGTPGARNSRFEQNLGPTYGNFTHFPVAPGVPDEVTVSVEATDPDGIASMTLHYSVNGGDFSGVAMEARGSSLFQGKVPPQAAAAAVQFYVEATDGSGAISTYPAGGPNSRALYKVKDGQAKLDRMHNVRILMTGPDTKFLHLVTNVMSNEYQGCTVVYDEKQVFHDVGVRLKSSERGRAESGRVGFHLRFQPDNLFRGVHKGIGIDRSGGGQEEILEKHIINHAGGVPGMYDDLIRVIAPQPAQTGPALCLMAAFDSVYLDSQYFEGSKGTVFKLELIYYPTTTAGGKPEGLKLPQPDDVIETDLRDLGNDKEAYRWNFLIQNNEDRDDYSRLMALCKAFSAPAAELDEATKAVMDVDEWMRTFAMYALLGVGDTYSFGHRHNNQHYVRYEDQKVLVMPWDMDFSFSNGATAPLVGGENLARIIQLPGNKRLFYQHLKSIMETTFNPGYISRWVDHYGSVCSQNFSRVTPYVADRQRYVLTQLPRPLTFAITTHGGNDLSIDESVVTIEGDASIDVGTIFLSGHPESITLRWTTPTRWNARVNLEFGVNELIFQAVDTRGGDAGSARINVTSTSGWPIPVIASVSPSGAVPGETVVIKGSSFHPGARVFFDESESPGVTLDVAGDADSLTAVVPSIPPGKKAVTVRNTDGRVSDPFDYTLGSTQLFLRGDARVDGALNVTDAIAILSHLFGGQPIACRAAADADANGTLELSDAIFILRFLFQRGQPPAEPFPRAGALSSPGDIALGCEKGLAR